MRVQRGYRFNADPEIRRSVLTWVPNSSRSLSLLTTDTSPKQTDRAMTVGYFQPVCHRTSYSLTGRILMRLKPGRIDPFVSVPYPWQGRTGHQEGITVPSEPIRGFRRQSARKR